MPRKPEVVGAARQANQLHVDTANKITRWIEQRDPPKGFHLKEQQLGEEFNLSRSPIRGALEVLAERGIVTNRPSRGFFLRISAADVSGPDCSVPDAEIDETYREISTAWFRGEIPEKVSTAELVRRYGGNSANISRVLSRLAADGVIVRSEGKGWRLGTNLATEAAFFQSYEFRLVIEPSAILLDSFEIDKVLAATTRRRHAAILSSGAQATIRQMVGADLEFHDLIADCCGNDFICQAIKRHNSVRRLTEILTTPDGCRLLRSSEEHMEILDALEGGRRNDAANLMRSHLMVSRKYVPDFSDVNLLMSDSNHRNTRGG